MDPLTMTAIMAGTGILKNELIDMERTFTMKKEQFLKIQGALEALNAVKANNSETDAKSAK